VAIQFFRRIAWIGNGRARLDSGPAPSAGTRSPIAPERDAGHRSTTEVVCVLARGASMTSKEIGLERRRMKTIFDLLFSFPLLQTWPTILN
jgi:hypothetical protein